MPLFTDLDAAEVCLERANAALDVAAQTLAQAAAKDGRISVSLLDERQIDAFRFTNLLSELRAAQAITTFARRDGGRLSAGMATAFVAEMLRELSSELGPRGAAWGLDREALAATIEAPQVRAFMTQGLDGAHWEALGELVAEQGTGDAGLDGERKLIQREFRRFAEQRVMPVAERVHRHDELIPLDIIQGVSDMGCFGLSIPESYGGLQPDGAPDNLGMVLVTEELSRGSLGVAGSLITRPEILSKALLKGGTEAQKQRWLPLMATGERLCAVAVTEPDFGSNVAGMKVTATPVDGGYLLNGQKTWCTFGGYADLIMVLARTDPDPKAGHRGLSILLAEKPRFEGHAFEHVQRPGQGGVPAGRGGGKMTGKAIDTIGYRGMHSFDIWFEDYFVPADQLIGEEAGLGRGFYYQMEGFAGGRLQTAARAIGVMQAAFERALTYAQERKVFAKPIADYQLTKWKLARMATIIATARQFTYQTAALLDRGEGQMEASMVKLWASRVAEWVAREAMQIHGGMGYAEEYDVSRYYLDARVFSIFEGAEEVLALRVVARQVLTAALAAA